jgi:hypothetical protein
VLSFNGGTFRIDLSDRNLQWATQKEFKAPDSLKLENMDSQDKTSARQQLPKLNMLKLKYSNHTKPDWNLIHNIERQKQLDEEDAEKQRNIENAKLLNDIKNGKDVRDLRKVQWKKCHKEYQNLDGDTALSIAIKRERFQQLEFLIDELGVDVNAKFGEDKRTALH